MTDLSEQSRDYGRIEKAIQYLVENQQAQPSLGDTAEQVGLSEYHFQKLFTRWAGVSPKRFMQFLTKEYARELLRSNHTVMDACYEAGLSSPGRLHDLFVQCEAVTPGELKSKGKGIRIDYGVVDTPFGQALLANTQRGICFFHFVTPDLSATELLSLLQAEWSGAELNATDSVETIANGVFSTFGQSPIDSHDHDKPITLLLKGTNFQIKVWEALLAVPQGQCVSYQQVAESIHMPKASRAVGSAIGSNNIAYLIPCHRVIQKMATPGQYRWGAVRKRAILGYEAAQKEKMASTEI